MRQPFQFSLTAQVSEYLLLSPTLREPLKGKRLRYEVKNHEGRVIGALHYRAESSCDDLPDEIVFVRLCDEHVDELSGHGVEIFRRVVDEHAAVYLCGLRLKASLP